METLNLAKLENNLLEDEGYRKSAYQDHLGFWTIGIGTLIDARKGAGITEYEAKYLLRNRLADRLEATILEMHHDQETSRKNCRDLVEAINKQIAEKEMTSLRTFAEKTELNALKLEHGRTLERIHDKLDKLSEKLSST